MKTDPFIFQYPPDAPSLLSPDPATAEAAWVGLIGWLAALEGHVRRLPASSAAANRPPHTTVMVVDRIVANGFQMGFFAETGPFLAYPPAFWWFPHAWRSAAAGPAGIVLLADDREPWGVLLPSDWPQAMTEFTALCRRWDQTLFLYPYAPAYFTALESAPSLREGISNTADLDQARRAFLPFLTPTSEETLTWLEPLLQSPWPA